MSKALDIGGAIVRATNKLVKVDEKLSESQLLAAAKKIYDDMRASIQDAGEALEKTADKAKRDIAGYLARTWKAHDTTQKKMTEETGIPQATISALCAWAGRNFEGTPYGPQRKEFRIRQVDCLIKLAMTPPEKSFLFVDGDEAKPLVIKGPPAADKPLKIPNFKETPYAAVDKSAEHSPADDRKYISNREERLDATPKPWSSSAALAEFKVAVDTWLPKMSDTHREQAVDYVLKIGKSHYDKAVAYLDLKTRKGKAS